MTARPPATPGARGVLGAVRAALDGAGPAVHLGGAAPVPVPAGVAAVVTTSGSTGYPKDVLLSRSALIASASSTAARIGEGAWLLALPATYVAGLQVLVRSLLAGHEPAILEGHFSVDSFIAAARGMASAAQGARTPTYTSLVPAQVTQLIAAADAPEVRAALASFEAILVGGQALPDAVRERASSLGARIVRTYGASETSGGCVYDGVPLDGVRVRIADGEVQLSGPMLAEGYRDDPERTAAAFVRDDAGHRWYRTGDAGSLEDARLRVTGRLDNVIVSGGVNVSLDRVERIVRGLPGFADAVVVGAAHERWGESPVVVVPADAAASARLDEVRSAVGADLGAPARPDRIEVVASLPLLPSGKPDRRALRALIER
ncbi:AMP-binding protein [Microbacterium sp. BG28]|uniref:AMP-binding protein n=1 Tax=Microbacterium sp. BG28 TaxID=3097356 RepID=UPI002A5B0FE0|nr:AMP-binding protein [Microbacterium sp. BG28]MDY0827817.1 AMP-binding protein [Microbacterium sp. BG28]